MSLIKGAVFDCQKYGHFRGSAICKGKKNKKPTHRIESDKNTVTVKHHQKMKSLSLIHQTHLQILIIPNSQGI